MWETGWLRSPRNQGDGQDRPPERLLSSRQQVSDLLDSALSLAKVGSERRRQMPKLGGIGSVYLPSILQARQADRPRTRRVREQAPGGLCGRCPRTEAATVIPMDASELTLRICFPNKPERHVCSIVAARVVRPPRPASIFSCPRQQAVRPKLSCSPASATLERPSPMMYSITRIPYPVRDTLQCTTGYLTLCMLVTGYLGIFGFQDAVVLHQSCLAPLDIN